MQNLIANIKARFLLRSFQVSENLAIREAELLKANGITSSLLEMLPLRIQMETFIMGQLTKSYINMEKGIYSSIMDINISVSSSAEVLLEWEVISKMKLWS
jgi:hypothetical protein